MLTMRVSLTARLVSHPSIDFGAGRRSAGHARLGLRMGTTVYHRPRRQAVTVTALRPQTSRFSFPAVGRVGRVGARRQVPPLGLPRAYRG
jgi:hypothetical protein